MPCGRPPVGKSVCGEAAWAYCVQHVGGETFLPSVGWYGKHRREGLGDFIHPGRAVLA